MLEFVLNSPGSTTFEPSHIRSFFTSAGVSALKMPFVRDIVTAYIRTNLSFGNYETIIKTYPPPGVKRDMAWYVYGFLKTVDRAIREGRVSDRFQDRMVHVLLWEAILNWGQRDDVQSYFQARGEQGPPRFLVISPANECNMRCEFCHTDSHDSHTDQLSYEEMHRIVGEAEQKWGIHFFLISGGEPFLWQDGNRGLLDLAADHPDSFFMIHTNGTTITEAIADRIARLGTIIPNMSVEGYRYYHDEQRGAGNYALVVAAMARLKKRGIPFGVCFTATRKNYDVVLSDGFLQEMFEKQGALYAMMLQYYPIGRSVSLDLMPTPEERLWMWERIHTVVREKQYVIADFLNTAPIFGGNMVAGRYNGYLHINWNGDVTPCTFMPFAATNIRDVFARGGTLNDVYDAPFLKAIRDWQRSYGFDEQGPQVHQNWLTPCLVRDHFAVLQELIQQHQPAVLDRASQALLDEPHYGAWLAEYASRFRALADPVWERDYLHGR